MYLIWSVETLLFVLGFLNLFLTIFYAAVWFRQSVTYCPGIVTVRYPDKQEKENDEDDDKYIFKSYANIRFAITVFASGIT